MSAQRTINRKLFPTPRFRRWRLLGALLLVGLLLSPGPVARAELTLPTVPTSKKRKKDDLAVPQSLAAPPQGVPQEARIVPGAQVEIPLTVYGRRGTKIRYRLRQNPKLGRVITIRQDDVDRATLVYEHTASMGAGGDQSDLFQFVAVDDNGSSAPVPITVTIVDLPARIEMPRQVRFGSIAIGDETSRTLTIRNAGGSIAQGTFEVDPPWQIEPADYHLGRGESVEVRLRFRAGEDAPYHGRLRMPQHTEKIVELLAEGVFPIVPEATEITLAASAETGVRTGTLALRNRTDAPRTFALETASQRLALPAEPLTLGPGESTRIALTLPPDDLAAFEGELKLVFGERSRKVTLHADAIAARLVATPRELSWGEVETGKEHPLTFEVENRGGTPAPVTVAVPEPFTASPERFELAPAGSQTVTVAVSPAWPGTLSGKVTLETVGNVLTIPLHAEIIRHRDRQPAPAPTRIAARTEGKEGESTALPINVAPKVTELRPTSITMTWKAPTDGEGTPLDLEYRLEVRQILLSPKEGDTKEGALHIQWVPIPTADIKTDGPEIEARITGIPESASATVRIVATRPDDPKPAVVGKLHFSLPAPPVYFTLQRLLLVTFALILVGALWLRTGRSLFGMTLHR
ncbi:MAG TPA: choice-of-anchor D domain-containing protein [Chthoniobacteraceae bacterium]|nr:choice-of-anchor D domain-containing protein [Chthoniobacteraceae bacterium]